MKKIINKWQFHWYFGREYNIAIEYGWKKVEIGIIKFIDFPEEGVGIQKKHYKGFWLKFYVWFPVDF